MTRAISSTDLLQIRNLKVWIKSRRGLIRAVDGVTLDVQRGELVGLVGESGSGKTMTGRTIMRLEPQTARIVSGEILLYGEDLVHKSANEMRALRGRRIGMVLQDPMTSLNPAFTIRDQVSEAISLHRGLRGSKLTQNVLDMLRLVRVPSAEVRVHQYPHQLSGGTRQRVTSAIALSCEPHLLIADEPTTALDVTIEAQYLELLNDLRRETGVGVLLISHDLMVVRRAADKVAVMYAGQIVERAPTRALFDTPAHPYTMALLNCIPEPGKPGRLHTIEGQPPDPANYPEGCRFAPRCQYARNLCRERNPDLVSREDDTHTARCWGTEPDGWIKHGRT